MLTAIRETLIVFLRRAFDIREGEMRRALPMQVNIFLLICTLLIVKPTANGLFLSRIGIENLPVAFLLVAFAAAGVSTLYSRLLPRISLHRIINGTLVASIGFLLFFGALLRLNLLEGWVLYLFYVWVAIFGVLSASQFWILANVVFNPREAKRLFGFIGAGAIAGGIFGGYLASLLAPLIGSENLPFVCAFLLLMCMPINRYIWRQHVAEKQTSFQQKKRVRGYSETPLRLILKSRHLTLLASIIGVSVVVAKLVDYQFSAIASASIEDPDELTAFFGFWFSNFNIISLVVQLFVTSRVVGVFGVGISLFVLPAGIGIGAVALLFSPRLWSAIFIKLSEASLKQSINKASIELLALPVPLDLKKQTKTFIDVFVDSVATGVGGLILIFLVTGLELSPRFISIMILGLLLLWIYLARQVREEYLRTFQLKVEQGETEKKLPDLSNESVWSGLVKVLAQGSEKQILYVLRLLREQQDQRLLANYTRLLDHPSPAVRAEVLRNLYPFREAGLTAKIEEMVRDPDPRVKVQAFDYLIGHHLKQHLPLMEEFLRSDNYELWGAALESLAAETRDNERLKSIYRVEERILEKLAACQQITDSGNQENCMIRILRAIGRSNMPSLYGVIITSFASGEPALIKEAIAAAGNTLDPSFLDSLLLFLPVKAYQEEAVIALAHYGKDLLPFLKEKIEATDYPVELVRMVPAVVKQVDSQRSVEFLFELLDYEDTSVRLAALRALNSLKIRFPHLHFNKKDVIRRVLEEAKLYLDTLSALYAQVRRSSMAGGEPPARTEARRRLVDLLERRLDGNLERIFRLLGLKYPPQDIINIYKGIQNKQPDLRINAIEFLDNLLDSGLKKVLMPIVETALLDTVSEEAIRDLNIKVPDEYECFKNLLTGKDLKIKLAVLHHLAQLGDKRYLQLVRRYRKSENPRIRDFAERAVAALES